MAQELPIGKRRATPRPVRHAAGDTVDQTLAATQAPVAHPTIPETPPTAATAAIAVTHPPAEATDRRPRLGTRLPLELVVYGVIGLLALLTRFYGLGAQAQHHDESLHSYFSWMYYVGMGYEHHPLMHGPFLFHAAALVYLLLGDSDASSRYAAALFGAATVVLPYFLRRELGRWGALTASVLLLTSPQFLYFGRFHRHDVYSAFFTLLLFVAIVRFVAERRPAWVFVGAAAWALLFTNKEDFFINTAIFGSALAIALLWRAARWMLAAGVVLLATLGLAFKVLPQLLGWGALPIIPWENPTNAAIRSYTIALLTNPRFLAPVFVLAGGVVLLLALLKRQVGEEHWLDALFGREAAGEPGAAFYALLRDQRTLWIAAGLAAGIYTLFYTSLFSNIPGILTGSFGAIFYWLGQHDVKRAEQPWFYYLLLLPQYDPLPFFVGLAGAALTGWRLLVAQLGRGLEGPQPFVRGFLAYWIVASLAIYSWAGEKMPWMGVHMVLPLLLLTAALLGTALEQLVEGRRARAEGRVADGDGVVVEADVLSPLAPRPSPFRHDLVVGGLVLAAVAGWFLGAARLSARGTVDAAWWLLLAPLGVIAAVVGAYAARSGWWRAGRVALLSLAAAVLLYQVHAGWDMAYAHGDVATEMLVYVQTSPDVTRVMREMDELSAQLTGGKYLTVMYDSNTSWPFQWYLRDYPNRQYFDQTLTEPPPDDVAIVLVGMENLAAHPELNGMLSNYVAQPYSMRWHFPEDETYRPFAIAPELPVGRSAWTSSLQPHGPLDVARSVVSSLAATTRPENQARLFRLLAYRDLTRWGPLGSYDFTVYVRRDLLPQYNDIRYR